MNQADLCSRIHRTEEQPFFQPLLFDKKSTYNVIIYHFTVYLTRKAKYLAHQEVPDAIFFG